MNGATIVVACCLINFLVLGTARMAPLLFVESMVRYNATRQEASFPFVLCYLVRMISGPLTGYIGKKFGLRGTTILGCLISAFGIGFCFFAESIVTVTIFWGGVYGLGFGFGSSLLPAILSLYFKENYTKAVGFSYVGSSLGAAILPLIFKPVIKFYGVSGAFILLGAFTLNGAVIAMLLKGPNSEKNKDSVPPKDVENQRDLSKATSVSSAENNAQNSKEVFDKEIQNSCTKTNDIDKKKIEGKQDDLVFRNGTHHIHPGSNLASGTPVLLRVEALKLYDTHVELKLYDTHVYLQQNLPSESKNNLQASIMNSAENTRTEKSALGSFHIFFDITFIVIVLIQSLFTFNITLLWTVIIDYVRDKGIDKSNEIYFLVCLPTADMIGRIGLGFVADGGCVSKTTYTVVCFFFMGLSSCLLVWSKSFLPAICSICFFSIVAGGVIIVLPTTIVEFMKSEDLTMAISSRIILYAPLSLTISPLIGFFRGTLGSYDVIFYICAAINIVCCVLTKIIPPLAQQRDRKELPSIMMKHS